MGCSRLGSFSVMSLVQAPERQRNSLWVGSGQCIGPSIPLKRLYFLTSNDYYFFFFFMEEVLMQGVGYPVLGDASILEEPSSLYTFPRSSFCWFSDSRASYLFYKGTWAGEVSHEGNHLPPQAEPISTPHSPSLVGKALQEG